MGELVWVRWFSGSDEWFIGDCEGLWAVPHDVVDRKSYKVKIDGKYYCVPPKNIRKIEKPATGLEVLQFIYYRMVNVHGESPNVDYMLNFKKIIDVIENGKD
jgi:hypothetical protein